jgi:hypothetical protein
MNDFLKEFELARDTRPGIVRGRTWIYLKDRNGNGTPISLGRGQLAAFIESLKAELTKREKELDQ